MAELFDVAIGSKTGFMPPCYLMLLSLKDGHFPLFHEQHSRRHPLSAYKTTLSRVEDAFIDVLDSFDRITAARDLSGEVGPLLERHRALYYSLAEHFEACEGAAESLVAAGEEKKHPLLKPFWNKARDYKHVDRVLNEVKHRHNEFVPIKFGSAFASVFGFYVSGIRTSECLGPNPNIHRKWHDQETAFSFNRDLRRLFVDIYRVGYYLSETLGRFEIPPAEPEAGVGSKLLHIATRISAIPDFCFPDEASQANQVVVVGNDGDQRTLRVACGIDRPRSIVPPGMLSVEAMLTVGVEGSHKLPYLGRR